MEPTNMPTPTPPTPPIQPTPSDIQAPSPVQTQPVVVQKSSSPLVVILSVLFGAILGAAITLGVLYYLNPNILALVQPSGSNNDNVVTPPKDDEVKTPTDTVDNVVPEDDPKEEEPTKDEIKYVSKSLGIEYWKGQGVFITAKLSVPEKATITDGGGAVSPSKIITYKDDETGTTVMTLTVSHFGLQTSLRNQVKVELSLIKDLYRVQTEDQVKNTPKIFSYSNDVKLTGTCTEGDQTYKAVCGLDQVEGLIVTVENSKKDFSVADKMASTMVITKK